MAPVYQMYRALKNAQLEIADTLMKFADEITTIPQPATTNTSANTNNNANLLEAIDALNKKHDAQFSMLVSSIDRLNSTLQKYMTAPSALPIVNTSSTIPSLNPLTSPADMLSSVKTVEVSEIEVEEELVEEVVEEVVEEIEEEVVEEEVVEEVEEEVVEEVEEEVVEEIEEEVEEQEEAEAEVEVEEWTYKGMAFFKDSNHIVYANDNGDVGEPIGKYDPVKKVLKKL